MAKRNLYSNAERRKLAISLYEDLSHYLEGKTVNAEDIAIPLAEAFNSKVTLYDVRKALAAAVFGCTGLGSISFAAIGAPVATMIFVVGAVLATAGFVDSAKKQRRLPAMFSNPEQIEWTGSDEAHTELQMYLEDVRSHAELVYKDGSWFEHMDESGWSYLAIAKSGLTDRSKEILRMNESTVPLVCRPEQRGLEPCPQASVSTPKPTGEQDRNWLPDLSAAEFQLLIDEFATFVIKGKLQPWSRKLLEHGKRFSDRHKIEDGRTFRHEFLRHLKAKTIRHPTGRAYEPEDLAAVFCVTNNTPPSACRRFLTDEEFRDSLRLRQNENQHVLPLPEKESGRIP